MARTFGAKNKPKFVLIELEKLQKVFSPKMKIPIESDFVQHLLQTQSIDLSKIEAYVCDKVNLDIADEPCSYSKIN